MLMACLLVTACRPGADQASSPFAKSNLHVWAYEEYDAVERSPAERAQVLVDLGISKAGYICRNAERVSEFEAYVEAYRNAGIELVGVWTPIHSDAPMEEVQVKTFLEVVDRKQLKLQWWLTLEQDFDAMPEGDRVEDALTRLRPLVREANGRDCRLVLYGHGRDRWFTQAENLLDILERLQVDMPDAELGIIYNFHQSHAQMDRLAEVLPRLKPQLTALNLNGMHTDGPAIARIGEGDREQEMIELIHQSGWFGPTGIIAHDRKQDAKLTLQQNLDGLSALLENIGDEAGHASYGGRTPLH